MIVCRYHCRGGCGGHFTSLRAFDAHRVAGQCGSPGDAGLVECSGICEISEFDAETAKPVRRVGAIWGLEGRERVRARFEARKRLNRPSLHGKQGALAA